MLAALFASDSETELGFFLKSDIVLSAACFCAHVVPCAGGGGDAVPPVAGAGLDPPPIPNLPNRDCNSLMPEPAGLGGGFGLLLPIVGGGSGALPLVLPLPLIPSPGTDTPAAPSRSMAPWFKNPACRLGGDSAATGDAVFCRGGNRGGRLGGGGFEVAPTVERVYGGGGGVLLLLPPPSCNGLAPSALLGGKGRFEVERPVVSAR